MNKLRNQHKNDENKINSIKLNYVISKLNLKNLQFF